MATETIIETLGRINKRVAAAKNRKARPKGAAKKRRETEAEESQANQLSGTWRRRQMDPSLDRRTALEQHKGSLLHAMTICGEESASRITQDQKDTAIVWGELQQFMRSADGIGRVKSGSDIGGVGGFSSLEETAGDVARSKAKRHKYKTMRRAALECGEPTCLIAIDTLLTRDAMDKWPSAQTVSAARIGLNAMSASIAQGKAMRGLTGGGE